MPQGEDDARLAAERFFRAYAKHCRAPDRDSLFGLLEAMHSLSDRLAKAHGQDLHDLQEFPALKALRNHYHHHEELKHHVRVVPIDPARPVLTDLLVMCLAPDDQVTAAIDATRNKYHAAVRASADASFHRYGDVVNINPALFNLTVRIYERLNALDVAMAGDDVQIFERSYAFETEQGLSHYVDGRLQAHAGSAAEIRAILAAEGP